MLTARDAAGLAAAQDGWVDPVNNLVSADTGGRIAYQCRGELPVRSSPAHRRLPVPGWDGACEWTGTVPFGKMPRIIDPVAGFVMTANNVIVGGDQPYISATFTQPFRAERIRERLAERWRIPPRAWPRCRRTRCPGRRGPGPACSAASPVSARVLTGRPRRHA